MGKAKIKLNVIPSCKYFCFNKLINGAIFRNGIFWSLDVVLFKAKDEVLKIIIVLFFLLLITAFSLPRKPLAMWQTIIFFHEWLSEWMTKIKASNPKTAFPSKLSHGRLCTYPNHPLIAQNISKCCSENPQSKWQTHFKIINDVNSSPYGEVFGFIFLKMLQV